MRSGGTQACKHLLQQDIAGSTSECILLDAVHLFLFRFQGSILTARVCATDGGLKTPIQTRMRLDRYRGASSCLAHPLVCVPAQSLREAMPGGRAAVWREQSCVECPLALVRRNAASCLVLLRCTGNRTGHALATWRLSAWRQRTLRVVQISPCPGLHSCEQDDSARCCCFSRPCR
jgi:hypothetical protein